MHLLVCLVGLLSLAWHTSGYAIDYAATSFEYDDYEYIDPTPKPTKVIEVPEDKSPYVSKMTEEELLNVYAILFGDGNHYDMYDSDRPKRSITEDNIERIVSTEHIVVPTDGKKHTIEDGNDPRKTNELQNIIDSPKHSIKNAEDSDKTNELLKSVDIAEHTTKYEDELNQTELLTSDGEDQLKTSALQQVGDSTKHTIEDGKSSHKTKQFLKILDISKFTTEDGDESHETAELQKDGLEQYKTDASQKVEDAVKHIDPYNIDESIKAIETPDHIFEERDSENRKFKEDAMKHIYKEIESMEHVIEEMNDLLMLEELYLTKDGEGVDSFEEVDRSARHIEWFGPLYPDYYWSPYWYPPIYPWGFYPGWSPYPFNPYPVAFPVNCGTFSLGSSEEATTKQYVPVKGKVTIAATFTDGTWSLPASHPTNSKGPCFYPKNDCVIPVDFANIPVSYSDIRNEPAPKIINAPCVQSLPVSGKAITAAHFCC